MEKVNLTKEQKAKANPFMLNNHYIGFDDWINQSFEMILDEDDKPIKVRGALQCFDEHSNPVYNDRYKLKRKNELWLILVTHLIRLALQQQNKSVAQNREIEPYIYYGTYASLRDDLAKHYPKELKNQLKQSINLSTISSLPVRYLSIRTGFFLSLSNALSKYVDNLFSSYVISIPWPPST